jgi:hypothetical protein
MSDEFSDTPATPATPTTAAEPTPISFAEFLESVPPSQFRKVSDICTVMHRPSGTAWRELAIPQLQLHCPSSTCNGPRFFRFKDGERVIPADKDVKLTFFDYICSNCRRVQKLFSLYISVKGEVGSSTAGECYKFGEHPAYGPPTPTRLLRLFGKDRETFLKGRQCENHGLGIGAFVYYRRMVENHKNQILDDIIKVARKVAPEMAQALEAAKNENQFLRAVESVKNAIPQALLIEGHNPLTLLHSALSEGLHAETDEHCLELAHDVRIVLAELAERISQALKDEAELNAAISRLMKPKETKKE